MHFRIVITLLVCTILFTGISFSRTRISPCNTKIRYTGRIESSNPENIRFDWPGVSIEMLFEGTSCLMEMQGAGESFNVFADGKLVKVLRTDSVLVKTYDVVSGLSDSLHRLLITKRFEHKGAISELRGFYLDKERELQSLHSRPPFRIEFVGASSVNGFGNESGSLLCDSTKVSDSSNCYYSFGPVAARALNAECVVLALTSKGLIRNWGSPFISWIDAFPEYYSRTLLNVPELLWNHNEWVPHVVVVSLGINDFSSRPNPPSVLFVNAYWAFLQTIYSNYPEVDIICLTSDREPVRSIISNFVKKEKEHGNMKIHFLAYDPIPMHERGCDWHPNINAHKKIAKKLVAVIKPILKKK